MKGLGWVIATAGAITPWWGPPLQLSRGSSSKTSSEIRKGNRNRLDRPGSDPWGSPLPKIREGATWVGAPPFKYLAGLADRRHPDYAEIDDFPCAGNSGEQASAICSTCR